MSWSCIPTGVWFPPMSNSNPHFAPRFASTADQPVQVNTEFLDLPEFIGAPYERLMTNYLHEKYIDHLPSAMSRRTAGVSGQRARREPAPNVELPKFVEPPVASQGQA